MISEQVWVSFLAQTLEASRLNVIQNRPESAVDNGWRVACVVPCSTYVLFPHFQASVELFD